MKRTMLAAMIQMPAPRNPMKPTGVNDTMPSRSASQPRIFRAPDRGISAPAAPSIMIATPIPNARKSSASSALSACSAAGSIP
jgi:hypothetical protein